MQQVDLFGNVVEKDPLLRDKFIEPPFSVILTNGKEWRNRKKLWKNIGLESEVGRHINLIDMSATAVKIKDEYTRKVWNKNRRGETLTQEEEELIKPYAQKSSATSIFDPSLCEVIYHWFCPPKGKIFDPFAGGSVRGIIAHYLGYNYTGIDIRQEQIDSNRKQAKNILDLDNQPNWIVGDSNKILSSHHLGNEKYDFVFSCPPYADLEVYSDLSGDISNMEYKDFMLAYESIIAKSCEKLIQGGMACFVVGEVRDKKGNYLGFVPDTIKAFKKAGMKFYNEAILVNSLGGAIMRANNNMKKQKLVKVHQNILTFIKR